MPTGKAVKGTRKLKRRVQKVNNRRLSKGKRPFQFQAFTRQSRKRGRGELGGDRTDEGTAKRSRRGQALEKSESFGFGAEPSESEPMLSEFMEVMSNSVSDESDSDSLSADSSKQNLFDTVIDKRVGTAQELTTETKALESEIEAHRKALAELETEDPEFFAHLKASGELLSFEKSEGGFDLSRMPSVTHGVNRLRAAKALKVAKATAEVMRDTETIGEDSTADGSGSAERCAVDFEDDYDSFGADEFDDDDNDGDDESESQRNDGEETDKIFDDIKLDGGDISDGDDFDLEKAMEEEGADAAEDIGMADASSYTADPRQIDDSANVASMTAAKVNAMIAKAKKKKTFANLMPLLMLFSSCVKLTVTSRQRAATGKMKVKGRGLADVGKGMFNMASSKGFQKLLRFVLVDSGDCLLNALGLLSTSKAASKSETTDESVAATSDLSAAISEDSGETASELSSRKNGMKKVFAHDSFRTNLRAIRHYLRHLLIFWEVLVTDDAMNRLVLTHLRSMALVIACTGEKATRLLSKRAVHLWCSGLPLTRVDAFLFMYELAVVFGANRKETPMARLFKVMYSSFVVVCRRVRKHSLPGLQFMINSMAQLYLISPVASYKDAFHRLRSVAFHVKNAIQTMSKHSHSTTVSTKSIHEFKVKRSKERTIESVYNWRFLNVLRLWAKVLCTHASIVGSDLHLLIYPFVQISLSVLDLSRSSQFDPFRVHIISMLVELVGACEKCGIVDRRIYIPLIPHILGVLDNPAFAKKTRKAPEQRKLIMSKAKTKGGGKQRRGAAVDEDSKESEDRQWKTVRFDSSLQTVIKVKDKYFNTSELHCALANHCSRLLALFLGYHSYSIGFPELAFPAQMFLTTMVNKDSIPVFLKKHPRALQKKIRENADWILLKRRAVDFGPMDTAKVNAFLAAEKVAGQSPLGKFLKSPGFLAMAKDAFKPGTAETKRKTRKKQKKKAPKKKKKKQKKKAKVVKKKRVPPRAEEDVVEDLVLSDADSS